MRARGRAIALCLACTLAGAACVFVLSQVLDRTDANREAIVVSCEALNRQIVRSQRPLDPQSATAYMIFLTSEQATPAQRVELARRLKADRAKPRLVPDDCEELVRKAAAR